MIDFKSVCEENNLIYSLVGGTLLGAVRHHGFIPWDDDVDFGMPRPDFDKMRKAFKDGKFPSYLKLLDFSLGNFRYPFARIIDTRTKLEQKYISNDNTDGVWIDIFPIDGISSDVKKQKQIYTKAKLIYKLMILSNSRIGSGTTITKKISKMIFIPIVRIIGIKKYDKILEKLAHQTSFENAKNVSCIIWGLYGTGEILTKNEFVNTQEIEFENEKFRMMTGWDKYLTNCFGNYMELPPVEQRASHSFQAWRK